MSSVSLKSYIYNKLSRIYPNTTSSDNNTEMADQPKSPLQSPDLTAVWKNKTTSNEDNTKPFKEDSNLLRLLRTKSMPSIVLERGSPTKYPAAIVMSPSPISSRDTSWSTNSTPSPISSKNLNPRRDLDKNDVTDTKEPLATATPPPGPSEIPQQTTGRLLKRSASDGYIIRRQKSQLRDRSLDVPLTSMPSVKNLRLMFQKDLETTDNKLTKSVQNHPVMMQNDKNGPSTELKRDKSVKIGSLKRKDSIKDILKKFERQESESGDETFTHSNERRSRSAIRVVQNEVPQGHEVSQDPIEQDGYVKHNMIRQRSKSVPAMSYAKRQSLENIKTSVKALRMQFEQQEEEEEPTAFKPSGERSFGSPAARKRDMHLAKEKTLERTTQFINDAESEIKQHPQPSIDKIKPEKAYLCGDNTSTYSTFTKQKSIDYTDNEKERDKEIGTEEEKQISKSPSVKDLRRMFEDSKTPAMVKVVKKIVVHHKQETTESKHEPNVSVLAKNESVVDDKKIIAEVECVSSPGSVRNILQQFETQTNNIENKAHETFKLESKKREYDFTPITENTSRTVYPLTKRNSRQEFVESMIDDSKTQPREEESEEEFYDDSNMSSFVIDSSLDQDEKSFSLEKQSRPLRKEKDNSDSSSSDSSSSDDERQIDSYDHVQETCIKYDREKEKAKKEQILEDARLERIAYEKAEQDRIAQEQKELERIAIEKAEHERLRKEKEEIERIRKEKAEKERLEQEEKEKEREKREKEQAEYKRLEKERQQEIEREENAKIERELREKKRREIEEKEKEENEKLKREEEEKERQRIENEIKAKEERERLERKKAEEEKREQERQQKDREEKEQKEKEQARLQREKEEQEQKQREYECLQREKAETEQKEREQEILQREKAEKEQKEKEQERLRREKAEKEQKERELEEQEALKMALEYKKKAEQERMEREKETLELQKEQNVEKLIGKFTSIGSGVDGDTRSRSDSESSDDSKSDTSDKPSSKVGQLIEKFITKKEDVKVEHPEPIMDDLNRDRRGSDVNILIDKFTNRNRHDSSSSSSSEGGSSNSSSKKKAKEIAPIPTVKTNNIPGKVRKLNDDELRFFTQEGTGATGSFVRTQSLRAKKNPPPGTFTRGGSLRVKSSEPHPLSDKSSKKIPNNCRQLRPDELRFFAMANNKNVYAKNKAGDKTSNAKQGFRLSSQGDNEALLAETPGDDQTYAEEYDSDSDSDGSLLREGEESSDEALLLPEYEFSLNTTTYCNDSEEDDEAHYSGVTTIDSELKDSITIESLENEILESTENTGRKLGHNRSVFLHDLLSNETNNDRTVEVNDPIVSQQVTSTPSFRNSEREEFQQSESESDDSCYQEENNIDDSNTDIAFASNEHSEIDRNFNQYKTNIGENILNNSSEYTNDIAGTLNETDEIKLEEMTEGDSSGESYSSDDEELDGTTTRPIEDYYLSIDEKKEYLNERDFGIFCFLVAGLSIFMYLLYVSFQVGNY